MKIVLGTLVFLLSCGSPPGLSGQVVDIWGNPISGATVMIEGHAERPETDSFGQYTFGLLSGALHIKRAVQATSRSTPISR